MMRRFLPLLANVVFLAAACGGESVTAPHDIPADPGDIEPGDIPDVPPEPGDESPPQDDGVADQPPDLPDVSCPMDQVKSLIAEGKQQLEDAEPLLAMEKFEKAVDVCPTDTDAVFGAALAEMIYGAELSMAAISVVKQASGQLLTEGPAPGQSQNEYLAQEFRKIFLQLRERFKHATDRLAQIEGKPLAFEVNGAPVYIGIKPTIVYRGRFDEGDVLIMQAVGTMLIGFFDFLAGQDLNTDLLTLVELIKDNVGGDTKTDFKLIGGAAAYLLNQDQRFLNVEATEGGMLFSDSRVRFAAVGPKLLAALDRVQALGHDGDHVSWVEKAGPNRVLYVQGLVKELPDGKTEEAPLTFEFDDQLTSALAAASESIKTPGKKVTLHGGVLPIMSLLVSFTAKVKFLDAMGLKLPIDIGQFEVPGLTGLLQSMIPNVIAFDWGEFFTNPVGLRTFFPKVTKDGQALDDNFVMEWECPADIQADGFPTGKLRLLCKDGTEVDGPHFQGTPDAIPADGVASVIPVMAFADPTWNGLAWVDLTAKMGQTDTLSYKIATLKTLNTAIAGMLDGILKLIPD